MKIVRYKWSALAFLFLIGICACSKGFLEISPKGILIAETTAEYDLLLNDISTVRLAAQNIMGDHVAAMNPYFNGRTALENKNMFKWEDDIYLESVSTTMYSSITPGIYSYNKVIAEVMKSKEGSEAEKAAIYAEALAGRAWSYFTLANLYAQPYSKATAKIDLGLPLLLEADLTKVTAHRSTVQQLYDVIVADLVNAIPKLPTTLTHRIRIARPAAEALLGKVYMFMGEYNLALSYLEDAVKGFEQAVIPVKIYDLKNEFEKGGFFFPIDRVWGPSYKSLSLNQEVVFLKVTSNSFNLRSNDILYTKEFLSLYTANDLRRNFFSSNPDGDVRRVFPNDMKRGYGKLAVNHGITITDIQLLLAECKARLNNLSGATAELLKIRLNRMPEEEALIPSQIASDRYSLIKFILEERLREFATEGFRWADMRRLSVDTEFKSTIGTSHSLYDMAGNLIETYQLRPERLTLRFPLYIAKWNPNLIQNP